MSNRLNQQRENKLQPIRMQKAIEAIEALKFTITEQDETSLQFEFKDHTVTFFPYSGWHSGKTIKDGRGLRKLINQIKNTES